MRSLFTLPETQSNLSSHRVGHSWPAQTEVGISLTGKEPQSLLDGLVVCGVLICIYLYVYSTCVGVAWWVFVCLHISAV